jgi:hypothetical protein
MTGLSKLDIKEKRAQRRRNRVARDLATDKYHQRVVPDKKRLNPETPWADEELDKYLG